MKELQQIYGSLELPQNGNLVHAKTKEELLSVLGFRSCEEAQARRDSEVGEGREQPFGRATNYREQHV